MSVGRVYRRSSDTIVGLIILAVVSGCGADADIVLRGACDRWEDELESECERGVRTAHSDIHSGRPKIYVPPRHYAFRNIQLPGEEHLANEARRRFGVVVVSQATGLGCRPSEEHYMERAFIGGYEPVVSRHISRKYGRFAWVELLGEVSSKRRK